MTYEKTPKTLSDDQIRVTKSVQSATDVLRSAQPYLEAATKSMRKGDRAWQEGDPIDPVPVPPHILRDLVTMVATQVKMNNGLSRHDKGDGDWNPFKGIDFEFD
jgi:hypothetical protein